MIQELVCLGDARCVDPMLPDKGTVLYVEIALATAIRWLMRANVSIPTLRIRIRSRIVQRIEGKAVPDMTRRHDFAS